jgi:putative ABC transport system permease protein
MARSTTMLQRRNSGITIFPTIRLALWRLQRAWGLLLITGIGMLAAVMIACTVPLYSDIAMTAGLRDTLNSSSQNADIVVSGNVRQASSLAINQMTHSLNQEFQKNLGPYLDPPQFSLQTQQFTVSAIIPGQNGSGVYHPGADKAVFTLIGASMDQTASHLTLIQGRLPQNNSNEIEIDVTQDTVDLLHLRVGSVLTTSVRFLSNSSQPLELPLTLHVVGIFKLPQQDDPYWHGEGFQHFAQSDFVTIYTGLASNQTLLSTLTRLSNDPTVIKSDAMFEQSSNLTWYYRLDPAKISINDLNAIVSKFNVVKIDDANNPLLQDTQTFLPSDTLTPYQGRIAEARLSLTGLLLLMLGLLLFFVSTMADLLVEYQSESIAVLRSRGASSRQVFGSLLTQGLGVAVVALIIGPLLALPVTLFLVQHTLSISDHGALNIITDNPLQVVWRLGWYPLVTVLVAIIAMVIAITRTLRLDVLSVRREAGRQQVLDLTSSELATPYTATLAPTFRPLWQRLHLDIVAMLIALAGYGFSVYISSAGLLDTSSARLLLAPLTLLGSAFLLLAGLLLFLRFFPLLLRLAAWVAAGSRGATGIVAFAHMARVPHRATRMTLLLAVAVGFAIFTLVCTASQAQRIPDVAAFQTGADISGTIPVNIITISQLKDITAAYRRVPGITSASLGYTKSVTVGKSQAITIDFKAVDADTFAQTAAWTPQDSSQSLGSLMQQLSAQRASAIARQDIPAIVDANTWDLLHLGPGANFKLNFSNTSDTAELINFTAVAEVQHIPTSATGVAPAVLVDFTSFATIFKNLYAGGSEDAITINTVWLRTRSDVASLKSVYNVLSTGDLRLDFVYDRRQIIVSLSHEPLYLALNGVLELGAATVLLLALLGSLIASWVSVRSRLLSFIILRALGATRNQIAAMLIWEQGSIYITALVLGIVFGGIFSVLAIPELVFTSVPPSAITNSVNNGVFYVAQSVPPIQLIIPPLLIIVLGVLLVICLLTLGIMIRIISRPSVGQALRLNED